MRPLMLSLCLTFVLALPATGQELPALDGQGSQTQSIELSKEAVTITLESGGALSVGQNGVESDGAARLTVNNLSVGVGQTGSGSGDGTHSTPRTAAGDVGSSERLLPFETNFSTPARDAPGQGNMSNGTVCAGTPPAEAQLSNALRHLQVLLVRGECDRAPAEVVALVQAHGGLEAMLWRHGVTPNQVAAITIADEVVIVSVVISAQMTEVN